jgi:hypothetical protein
MSDNAVLLEEAAIEEIAVIGMAGQETLKNSGRIYEMEWIPFTGLQIRNWNLWV